MLEANALIVNPSMLWRQATKLWILIISVWCFDPALYHSILLKLLVIAYSRGAHYDGHGGIVLVDRGLASSL